MVDADAFRFPAALLFEWRRDHERVLSESLGKAGAILRQRVLQRQLAGFEDCSYLAQQLIIDKPDYWEFLLTAELLRTMLDPIRLRWEALEKGLYALAPKTISLDGYMEWHLSQLEAMSAQVHALSGLFNGELQTSWGVPGEPGSEHEILRMCGLVREASERILKWEEEVRFVRVPSVFQEARNLLVGIAGGNASKVFKVPGWINSIFAADPPSGTHQFTIEFDLPDGWVEETEHALDRAVKAIGGDKT
jgi:hypothetical protein